MSITRPATATRALIDWLRQEIYSGQLAPGSRLRQSELAGRFGVSTTPVREALSALQAEGLVNVDPHRGAVVFQPNPDDVREAFEIREALEVLAVEAALPRLDDVRLAELQALIDRMRGAVDYAAWSKLNEAFHARLYSTSGRRRLCELIESLRVQSQFYIHLAVAGHVPNEQADAEHQAILDACRARDGEAAKAALRTHIESTARQVLAHLDGGAESG